MGRMIKGWAFGWRFLVLSCLETLCPAKRIKKFKSIMTFTRQSNPRRDHFFRMRSSLSDVPTGLLSSSRQVARSSNFLCRHLGLVLRKDRLDVDFHRAVHPSRLLQWHPCRQRSRKTFILCSEVSAGNLVSWINLTEV